MRRTEQRQGLRMLKLRDVMSRWEAGSLSQLEAAEIGGMRLRDLDGLSLHEVGSTTSTWNERRIPTSGSRRPRIGKIHWPVC